MQFIHTIAVTLLFLRSAWNSSTSPLVNFSLTNSYLILDAKDSSDLKFSIFYFYFILLTNRVDPGARPKMLTSVARDITNALTPPTLTLTLLVTWHWRRTVWDFSSRFNGRPKSRQYYSHISFTFQPNENCKDQPIWNICLSRDEIQIRFRFRFGFRYSKLPNCSRGPYKRRGVTNWQKQ